MELTVLNIFTAKGHPVDLAAYTVAVLKFLKAKAESDESKKSMRDMTFEDLLNEMIKSGQKDEEDE